MLARTPGVTVARNGGIGQTSGVFIRGAESYQTLVLLDGVKINDPSAPQGGVDFGQLLAGNIARIEVLRGASGIIWGSQAIGGVVNIVSEQPSDTFEARGRAEYGYRDSYQGFANIAGASGFLEGSAGAGYLNSDGISAFDENLGATERDGYENFTANGKLRAHLGEALSLDARGYYINGHTEFDGTPPPSFMLTDTGSFSENELFVGYVGANLSLLDDRFRNRLAYTYTDVRRDNFDRMDGADVPGFQSKGKLDRFEYRGSFTPLETVTLLFGAGNREVMNCAASAASKTPSNLVITASALSPKSRMIGPAAHKVKNVSASTIAIAERMTIELSSPSFCDISSMIEAIEPGPASIGMAIGKIDTSSTSG